MADIVSTHWDFGNGETSNEQRPIVQFEPGVYNITLELTDSDGTTFTETRVAYVNVGETSTTLADGNYLDYPKCLHFGWKDEHGFGWSFNEGNFPWPITPGSIIEYEEDGILYTLVYDITDGLEYHINTYNNHAGKAAYKDKGTFSIETEMITPEFTGDMKSFDMSHVETNVKYVPDILKDDFDPDFEVNMSLITDRGAEPVETQYNVNTRNEIMFYYQNRQTESTRQRQLKINTTESNFQLLNYESYFKRNDRLKRATVNESMALFGCPTEWYTRGKGYNFNRTYGTTNTNVIDGSLEGADGVSDSAVTVTSFDAGNDAQRASMVLWSQSVPTINHAVTLVEYGSTVNGWQLYYYNGAVDANVTITGTMFDLRLFNVTVTEEVLFEYHDKFKQYLPRA
jgi:hypothetical protein